VPTPLYKDNYLLLPLNAGRRSYTVTGNNLNSHLKIPIYYLEDISEDMLLVPVYEHAGLVICIDVYNKLRFYIENIEHLRYAPVIVTTNNLIALSTKPTDPMNEILVFQE
jgi:hypothetical protein